MTGLLVKELEGARVRCEGTQHPANSFYWNQMGGSLSKKFSQLRAVLINPLRSFTKPQDSIS